MGETRLREIEIALDQGARLTLTAAELLELVRTAREANRLRDLVRSTLWSSIQRVDAALDRLEQPEQPDAGEGLADG